MKIAIVLTNDWELFGDGSGDYFDIQEKPLRELLSLLGATGGKITLMAEVMQQFYFRSLSETDGSAKEIADSWETALKDTIDQNHDVQLHIHPQWLGAKGPGTKPDMAKWALSSLPNDTIEELVIKGKNYLDELLTPVRPGYSCRAFRAGGYGIQPEKEILPILRKNGIICDSSVSKNLYSEGMYDFRQAPSNIIPWHTAPGNLCLPGNPGEGLLELPVYSVTKYHSLVLKKLSPALYYNFAFDTAITDTEIEWMKERDRIKAVKYPVGNRYYKKNQRKGPGFYLKALLSRAAFQLDYDYIPASVFLKIIDGIISDKNLKKYNDNGIVIPVIASGHVKDMHSTRNLELIIDGIGRKHRDNVGWWTLTEAIDHISSKNLNI